MATQLLPGLPPSLKPLLGMLHLPPLPGAPRFDGNLAAVRDTVLRDADALVTGGVHGLIMENFNDTPFYPGAVPPIVVAHMTVIAGEVRRRFDVPLGINVLRNDGRASLAIAHAVGAAFIRINILAGARVTDQGVIEGQAHDLLRERAALGAAVGPASLPAWATAAGVGPASLPAAAGTEARPTESWPRTEARPTVRIFADVNVKHSMPLGRPRALEDEVSETLERSGADAVIVTGRGTGMPTDPEDAQRVRSAAGDHPVIVGSGLTAETIGDFMPFADGFIVGTSLKIGGLVHNPVDPERVRAIVARVKAG